MPKKILENSSKYLEISGNTSYNHEILIARNTMTYFYVFPFLEILKKKICLAPWEKYQKKISN
jgi:hypothetical protein